MSGVEKQINLLPRKEYREESKKHQVRLVRSILFIFFLASALISAGIWSAVMVLASDVSSSNQKIVSLKSTITSLSAREQKIQLLSNRLKTSSTILSTRPAFEKELDQVVGTLPVGVVLVSAELEKSGKIVTLKLLSPTYRGFQDALSTFKNGNFARVDLTDISRKQTGEYSIEFIITLP